MPAGLLAIAAGLVTVGAALQVLGWSREWLVQAHAAPARLQDTWAALTVLGFGWPLLILGVIMSGPRAHALALLAKTTLLAMGCSQLPKLLWPLPRPSLVLDPGQLAIVGEPVIHTGSMPSGHALAAFAVLGAAWLSRRNHHPSSLRKAYGQRLGWILAWSLVALVAWSRVAVGAHWPADVFVGAGVGLCVAVVAWRWERMLPWQGWFARRVGQRATVVFLVAACVSWFFTKTGYPTVQWLQWVLASLAMLEAVRRQRQSITADSRQTPARSGAAPI